ncbi:MAG: BamA/TamA family outer membrane protein [Luteitalea sp.]|nr:BamA/TamA family outer membrane protein [Luteitalea sp.]
MCFDGGSLSSARPVGPARPAGCVVSSARATRRGRACLTLLFTFVLLVSVAHAHQDDRDEAIAELVGKPITSVRIERDGEEVDEPQVRALVLTAPGQPLALDAVRQSLFHLVHLGRFEDVRIAAEPDGRGVRLTYVLVPIRAITTLRFAGTLGLPERTLQSAIVDRLGSSPPAGRMAEAVAALRAAYADHGFLRPSIDTAVQATRDEDELVLVFNIDAGVRARVGEIIVEGDPLVPVPQLLRDLRLGRGQYVDRPDVDQRIDDYTAELRRRRYYEATISLLTSQGSDQSTIDVSIQVAPGPLVTLRFAGDPLPGDAERDLVPLEREGAADEDLLEDSKRRIEEYLRSRGYWRAEVSYQRTRRGDTLDIVFTIRRGRAYVTRRVTFEGGAMVPEAELRPLVTLPEGEPFVASEVDRATRALLAQYHRRGLAAAEVEARVDDLTPDNAAANAPGAVAVRFVVSEGPQTMVGRVAITGAHGLSEAELRKVLTTKAGAPLSVARAGADRDALQRLYLDRGFRQARVEAVFTRVPTTTDIDVTYRLDEGPQTLVDRILVVGNTRTDAETIVREVTLEPGGPLGFADVAESQRRLSALGLFRSVRITDAGDVGRMRRDVIVAVEEAPATTVGYGVGIEAGERLRRVADTDGGVGTRLEFAGRGFFEIGRRNLWGKNRAVNLFMRASLRPREAPEDPERDGSGLAFNEYRVVGTYREPRMLDLGADVNVLAFGEQAIRSSFNFRRGGIRVDVSRALTRRLTVIGRYGFGRTELFDVRVAPEDQITVDRLFPQVRLSTLAFSVINDTRNDPLDPSAGTLISMDGELSARAIGSEVGFVKGFWQGFVYRRMPQMERTVVALGARLGLAEGLARPVPVTDEQGNAIIGSDGTPVQEEVRDVPISERFFAGGDTTVRGFTLDRLGAPNTLDRNGFPTGGNALVVLNAELRFPLWRSLGGVLFTDAGNVFRRAAELALDEIRGSIGFGLRYRSPIGPVRVDWGFKLDRQTFVSGEREDRSAWHVSIGQAF